MIIHFVVIATEMCLFKHVHIFLKSLNLSPQTFNAMKWPHPCLLCWVCPYNSARNVFVEDECSFVIVGPECVC